HGADRLAGTRAARDPRTRATEGQLNQQARQSGHATPSADRSCHNCPDCAGRSWSRRGLTAEEPALRADSSACGRPRLLAVADQPGVSLIELIGSRNRLMSPLRPSPQPVPLLLVRKCSDLFAGLAPQAPRTPHNAVFMAMWARAARVHRIGALIVVLCLEHVFGAPVPLGEVVVVLLESAERPGERIGQLLDLLVLLRRYLVEVLIDRLRRFYPVLDAVDT